MNELPSSRPPGLEALTLEGVEWLPSGGGAGLLRVRGRWIADDERAGRLPVLGVRRVQGGETERFESLPDARAEAGGTGLVWRGAYVVSAGLVEGDPAELWLEWEDGSRAPLPAPARGGEAQPVAPVLPPDGAGARPEAAEAGPAPEGGQVIDRAVLAERRARKAEAGERAQARVAGEALKAVEVLELRGSELERRMRELVAEREALAARVQRGEPTEAAEDAEARAEAARAAARAQHHREALAGALNTATDLRARSREWRLHLRTSELARTSEAVRLAVLESEHTALRPELGAARAEIALQARELERERARGRANADAIAAAHAEASRAAAALAGERAAHESTRRGLAEKESELRTARTELARVTDELTTVRAQAEEVAASLSARVDELQSALDTERRATAAAAAGLETARAAAAAAEARSRVEAVARAALDFELERERAAREALAAGLDAERAARERADARLREAPAAAATAPVTEDPGVVEPAGIAEAPAAAAAPGVAEALGVPEAPDVAEAPGPATPLAEAPAPAEALGVPEAPDVADAGGPTTPVAEEPAAAGVLGVPEAPDVAESGGPTTPVSEEPALAEAHGVAEALGVPEAPSVADALDVADGVGVPEAPGVAAATGPGAPVAEDARMLALVELEDERQARLSAEAELTAARQGRLGAEADLLAARQAREVAEAELAVAREALAHDRDSAEGLAGELEAERAARAADRETLVSLEADAIAAREAREAAEVSLGELRAASVHEGAGLQERIAELDRRAAELEHELAREREAAAAAAAAAEAARVQQAQDEAKSRVVADLDAAAAALRDRYPAPEAESAAEPDALTEAEPPLDEPQAVTEAGAVTEPEPLDEEAVSEAGAVTEPDPDALAEPEADAFAAPEADAVAEPEATGFAEPEADAFTEPEADASAEPEATGFADPEADAFTEADADAFTEPGADAFAEPEATPFTEPQPEQHADPGWVAGAEPYADLDSPPLAEPDTAAEPESPPAEPDRFGVPGQEWQATETEGWTTTEPEVSGPEATDPDVAGYDVSEPPAPPRPERVSGTVVDHEPDLQPDPESADWDAESTLARTRPGAESRAEPDTDRPRREISTPRRPPPRADVTGDSGREYPWLRGALVKLAHDDPRTAGRLLVSLLPAQGPLLPEPVDYDLTIEGMGTFAIGVGGGRASVAPLAGPRPRRDAEFHLRADVLTLAELLAGVPRKVGRFSGPARFSGRKRRLKVLEALSSSTAGLVDAANAGAVLDPGPVFRALPYAIHPSWTRGHVFTVAQEIATDPPETWYITATDGSLTVDFEPPPDVDATVTLTPDAFLSLLRRETPPADQRPVIRGDRHVVEVLREWLDRAQGLEDEPTEYG